ncbi:MAG TPA: ABC transporter permease subunit [Candidatus Dormibacteraeota bacterium]|nr:ABC transporter permease subunit [Candidatus Dormibacteraeota bacterium]
MLLLALPGCCYFIVFYYLPLLGYVVAFQNYLPFIGFVDSPFVGLDNFRSLFTDPGFWAAVENTIVISLLQLLLYFPVPIGLAILINGLISTRWRRFIQSVVYLPHFVSWVIIVALFQQMLGSDGPVVHALRATGLPAVDLMTSPPFFKWLVTLQLIWKDAGWGAIIYLAALLSIDPTLYEAATVDGAGRWRRLWHVTLPGLIDITILLLILRIGALLSVGFEQIILQRDNVGPGAGEVLDTYVYFHGIAAGQWGLAAAAGILKAVIAAALVIGANRFAHRLGYGGVYT